MKPNLKAVYLSWHALLGLGRQPLRVQSGGKLLGGAEAILRCAAAGIEVVLTGGGTHEQMGKLAELYGQVSWIFEAGGGVAVGGEVTLLGETLPGDGTPYEYIRDSGAPELLLDCFVLELDEPEAPRQVSYLFRGRGIDLREVNNRLRRQGFGRLMLVGGDIIDPEATFPSRAYYLLPRGAGLGVAIAFHQRARGYAADECIVIGSSSADAHPSGLVAAEHFVNDALVDPQVRALVDCQRAPVTERPGGDGVLDVIERYLGEAR